MRIESERASIQIDAGPEPEDYSVSSAVDGFSGANPRISIDANALREFISALERLERDRQGEAHLSAMSSDNFELTIRIIDPLGHVSARATLGHGRYEGHRYLKSQLAIEFDFDPTALPSLVLQVRELLR
jgi:hypothetical protein